MPKPLASLSIDLDNKWSYLKTHGDPAWSDFPSYLDVVVPRLLDLLHEARMTITVFIVGQDAALAENARALSSIADQGHEIGNHSFHHEPWLHRYSRDQLGAEIARAEEHIERVTGQRPIGFRGPGYSVSDDVIGVLLQRGYEYDASTFPTFIGPLARAYYFFRAKLDTKQKEERRQLFGTIKDGLRPLQPYPWRVPEGKLTEIPVTTMPGLRAPIHVSYLLYLAQYSRRLARSYFRFALSLCRATRVQPSLLIHPLDVLGGDDESDLDFFPAMKMTGRDKTEIVRDVLRMLAAQYRIVTLREHAASRSTGSLQGRARSLVETS